MQISLDTQFPFSFVKLTVKRNKKYWGRRVLFLAKKRAGTWNQPSVWRQVTIISARYTFLLKLKSYSVCLRRFNRKKSVYKKRGTDEYLLHTEYEYKVNPRHNILPKKSPSHLWPHTRPWNNKLQFSHIFTTFLRSPMLICQIQGLAQNQKNFPVCF